MDNDLLDSAQQSQPPAGDGTQATDEHKSADEAISQLPSDLEQELPPTNNPPPVPTADLPGENKNIPLEKPETIKPPSALKKTGQKIKKHGVKIGGGLLLMALVIGGVVVGIQEVGKRQVVEKKARESCPKAGSCAYYDCSQQLIYDEWDGKSETCPRHFEDGICLDDYPCDTNPCNLSSCESGGGGGAGSCSKGTECIGGKGTFQGDCQKIVCPYGDVDKQTGAQDGACDLKDLAAYYEKPRVQSCDGLSLGTACGQIDYLNESGKYCEPKGCGGYQELKLTDCDAKEWHMGCEDNACVAKKGKGKNECSKDAECTAAPSPSPSPSPSPGPEYSCVGMTGGTEVNYGETGIFTCEADFSAVEPLAFFRYSVDGGTYTESPAIPIDLTSNRASYEIEINQFGDWLVQCRVCNDDTATDCTEWGQAD